jgi:DNA-binding response OmpR family regulator
VERIAQRAPNVVLNEELMALLPRSRDGSTLRVHVGKARKKLMPFDIVILSDHSLGYRMALADVEAIRGLG